MKTVNMKVERQKEELEHLRKELEIERLRERRIKHDRETLKE